MIEDLKKILAYYRKQKGATLKKALKAVLSIADTVVDQMDDDEELPTEGAPVGAMDATDPEANIQHLEEMVAEHKGKRSALTLPAWLLPFLMQLAQQWLAGKKE